MFFTVCALSNCFQGLDKPNTLHTVLGWVFVVRRCAISIAGSKGMGDARCLSNKMLALSHGFPLTSIINNIWTLRSNTTQEVDLTRISNSWSAS